VIGVVLSAFLTDRCDRLKGSSKTLRKVISMLKTYSGQFRYPWLEVEELREVNQIVNHLEYIDQVAVRRVSPLTIKIISKIINSPVVLTEIKTMIAVAHDSLARGGEICSGLRAVDLTWTENKRQVTIALPRSKCHRKGGSQFLTIQDYGKTSGVRLLKRHFIKHNLWLHSSRYVFPSVLRGRLDWSRPMSTAQFRSSIKHAVSSVGLDPFLFGGHSARAGGATDLFNAKVSYPVIKKMGRWKSETGMIYYRDEDEVARAVTNGFALLSKPPKTKSKAVRAST